MKQPLSLDQDVHVVFKAVMTFCRGIILDEELASLIFEELTDRMGKNFDVDTS